MINLIMSISMYMNIIFLTMKSPTSMGLILMTQIILMSLLMSLFSMNYWFSFILFIVMIGGLMVLFIYMTSLAPNSMFSTNLNMLIFILTAIMISFMTLDMMLFNNFFIKNNLDMNSMEIIFNNNNMLTKIYNMPINKLTWLMILYLLMTLIIAAKLVKNNLGSLRQLT
uniref:NADH dehydrogenase subunit 6 n=1 Tax=Semidalis macleodi TaxID=2919411 RepID=UPI001FA739BC|nr:NADH dehydrogenase subunit 6 [Semidalis macleodi]ULR86832.1 NADH dehydrogenase subunit 6 [Semidalis macleodi]